MIDYIASQKWANTPLRRFGLNVVASEKRYPPKPAQSRYRRTGTLGRSWFSQQVRSKGKPAVRVANRTPYAGWVQDLTKQVVHHARTGWLTYQEAVGKNLQPLWQDIADEIQRFILRTAKK